MEPFFKKIAFINMPNSPLIEKKRFEELSLGACTMVGGLEHAGFHTDYYDFNKALRRVRSHEDRLSEADKRVLMEPESLFEYLRNPPTNSILIKWATQLIDEIEDFDFSFVGLSFDRKGYTSPLSIMSLHFGVIFGYLLKQRTQAPIIWGGRHTLAQVGKIHCQKLESLFRGQYFDEIFYREAHSSFPDYLAGLINGHDPRDKEMQALVEKKSFFSDTAKFLPQYFIKNDQDLRTSVEDIFPLEILHKFPELKEIAPFFLAPFKMSIGCPFKCAFCRDGTDDYVGYHETERAVDMLKSLSLSGVRFFRFFNNNINPSLKFVRDFEELIRKKDVQIFYSDSANMRVTSAEVFKLLESSGCIKLWYGTETVSDRMLHKINKKVKFSKVMSALEWADHANIWNCLNFIYNFPHESEDDFNELTNFINHPLVNSGYYNEFQLHDGIAYHLDPEKFDIRLREFSDNKLIGSYDEIGGLTWEEKVKQGIIREEAINRARSQYENGITAHDMIIFAIRQVTTDKVRVNEIVQKLLSYLRERNEVFDYYWSIHWSSDIKPFLPQGEYIHNNIVSKSNSSSMDALL